MNINSNTTLFIHKFKFNDSYYIYDVNSDQIVEVEAIVYKIINHMNGNSKEGIYKKFSSIYEKSILDNAIDKIEEAKRTHGLFSSFRPKNISLGPRSPEEIVELHRNYGLRQLILEITKSCNLNCSYCPNSGKYSNNNTAKTEMSKQILKRSIDFFYNKNIYNETAISFYGGEPLLRFDLIKNAVNYIKQKYGIKPHFNITTNGTLLNKKILDFFVENDISIFISLDGPEKVNDRYRIFGNKKGTYKRIINNLNFIKKDYSEYFKKRVMIICVLAPPFNYLNEIMKYFSENENFRGKVKSSFVDTRGTTFFNDFGVKNYFKKYEKVIYTFIKSIKKNILEGNLSKLSIEMTSDFYTLARMIKIPNKKLFDCIYPFGACHIGLQKLYVNTEGCFLICEKSGNKYYKVGNIENGFDYNKIVFYYKKLEEALQECLDCWAIHYCERCWAQIGNLYEFKGDKKLKFCFYKKKMIKRAFKMYIDLTKKRPDFYKVFQDYQIG